MLGKGEPKPCKHNAIENHEDIIKGVQGFIK